MADRYWVGGTDNWDVTAGSKWAATSGGAGGETVPTASDNVFFDGASGNVTVTCGTSGQPCLNLDCTGFVGTLLIQGVYIYGSVTFVSGMTLNTNSSFTLKSTSLGNTVTTAGKVPQYVYFDGVGGEWILQDDLTTKAAAEYGLLLINGILRFNNKNVTTSKIGSSYSNVRSLYLGNGTITLTGAGGRSALTMWDLATVTNLTFDAGSSTILFNDSGTKDITFAGGGLTYNNLTIKRTAAHIDIISGSNTFNTFTINATDLAQAVRFTKLITQTISNFVATGSSGKVITIDSTTAGSAATLSKASGTVSCDYLSLKDSTATGGASWYAGVNSTNVSGNSGWVFTAPPPPTVSSTTPTLITSSGATLNGLIADATAGSVTERGFQWNTVAYPSMSWSETGAFSNGAYSHAITGLTASQDYFFRAYMIVAGVTYYGEWTPYLTLASTYNITIASIDRTDDVIASSIVVEDVINDKANTCSLTLIDRGGDGTPATDDEIVITLDGGTILFGGYITGVKMSKKTTGAVEIKLNCVDYTYVLDRNLAHISYTSETDAAIISNLINRYCAGFGITTANVLEGVTINTIKFNYIQLSQAMRKIAELTGRNWYVDYEKDVHYFPLTTDVTPFDIDSTTNTYSNLQISKDTSQLKNRVYVRGGTKLSDPTTYSTKGDGVAKQFNLPDKPHSLTLTVNGSPETVGIKNIDTEGYDWYLNFQEKYLEQDAGGAVLETSDTLIVTYTYDIPILVAVEDTTSILENGVKEYAIFDKSIDTTQGARDRASAELTDYANDVIEGSFITYTSGFRSGQYININLSEYGINDNYLVQRVVARSFGAGNYYYQIYVASSKTLGIIKFLIRLLETNKNVVELDDDEVVDELLQIQDSLLSDSLVESLTIDSTGPYFTWCTDSLDATPITRARWDLFQWS